MLRRILERFREASAPIDLGELSRELDVERSALDGMLLQLVRLGKLREISTEARSCGHCGSCAASCSSPNIGRVFSLPSKREEVNSGEF